MAEKTTKNEVETEKKTSSKAPAKPSSKAPAKPSSKAPAKKEKVKKKPEDYVISDELDFLGKKCEVMKNIQSQKLIRVRDLESGAISLVGYSQL